MPIKSNSVVSLFLQVIIHMLKVNEMCAIVLPYGQELQSKNSNLSIIGEYLMKTCNLKEIYIYQHYYKNLYFKFC